MSTRETNRPYTSFEQVADCPYSQEWQARAVSSLLEDQAEDLIRWLQTEYPDWADFALGHLLVGASHLYLENFAVAMPHFVEASGSRLLRTAALCNIARVQFQDGRVKQALSTLQEARPGSYLVHVNRLCFTSLVEDPRLFAEAAERCTLEFDAWEAAQNLGTALEVDRDLDFARETCPELLDQLSPENMLAHQVGQHVKDSSNAGDVYMRVYPRVLNGNFKKVRGTGLRGYVRRTEKNLLIDSQATWAATHLKQSQRQFAASDKDDPAEAMASSDLRDEQVKEIQKLLRRHPNLIRVLMDIQDGVPPTTACRRWGMNRAGLRRALQGILFTRGQPSVLAAGLLNELRNLEA